MSDIVNLIPTSTGKVRTVCWSCDRRSRPRVARPDGRPSWWDWPRGWSESPASMDHVNADGSRGPTFTCPHCARLRVDRQAAGADVLLQASPRRAAAIAARQTFI